MKVSETERLRFLETLDHKMVQLDALQRRVAVRAGITVSAEELDEDIALAHADLRQVTEVAEASRETPPRRYAEAKAALKRRARGRRSAKRRSLC